MVDAKRLSYMRAEVKRDDWEDAVGENDPRVPMSGRSGFRRKRQPNRCRALPKRSDDEHFSARTLLRNLGVFSEISQLNVPRPQRRRRKFSQGEKRMRSATRPMTTMTIMMATTWSMA